jgi:transposase
MARKHAKEPITWREGRRLRAWTLFQQGWRVSKIAAILGVTHGAVSQWLARARKEGGACLRDRKPPGRPSRLTPEQQASVPAWLAQGAEAWGFRGDRWTRGRVAELLHRQFGVRYHPAHVSRLLTQWGWSRQKPKRLARQRDEAAIQEWREQRWPAIQNRGPASTG